jgi:hypothetical protein
MSSDAVIGPAAGVADTGGGMGVAASAGRFAPFGLLNQGPVTVPALLAWAWPPPLATAIAVEHGGQDSVRVPDGHTLIAEVGEAAGLIGMSRRAESFVTIATAGRSRAAGFELSFSREGKDRRQAWCSWSA